MTIEVTGSTDEQREHMYEAVYSLNWERLDEDTYNAEVDAIFVDSLTDMLDEHKLVWRVV